VVRRFSVVSAIALIPANPRQTAPRRSYLPHHSTRNRVQTLEFGSLRRRCPILPSILGASNGQPSAWDAPTVLALTSANTSSNSRRARVWRSSAEGGHKKSTVNRANSSADKSASSTGKAVFPPGQSSPKTSRNSASLTAHASARRRSTARRRSASAGSMSRCRPQALSDDVRQLRDGRRRMLPRKLPKIRQRCRPASWMPR